MIIGPKYSITVAAAQTCEYMAQRPEWYSPEWADMVNGLADEVPDEGIDPEEYTNLACRVAAGVALRHYDDPDECASAARHLEGKALAWIEWPYGPNFRYEAVEHYIRGLELLNDMCAPSQE